MGVASDGGPRQVGQPGAVRLEEEAVGSEKPSLWMGQWGEP